MIVLIAYSIWLLYFDMGSKQKLWKLIIWFLANLATKQLRWCYCMNLIKIFSIRTHSPEPSRPPQTESSPDFTSSTSSPLFTSEQRTYVAVSNQLVCVSENWTINFPDSRMLFTISNPSSFVNTICEKVLFDANNQTNKWSNFKQKT